MNLRASMPRLWGNEWQITRVRWERGVPGMPGGGYSAKLSVKIVWEPRDMWVGLYWTKPEPHDWLFYICLLPCLPLRVHFIKSFGGVFP
jgi:hypothetical protein